jgi:carboxymethylenebutenolidase
MVIREETFIDVETPRGAMRTYVFEPKPEGRWPGVIFYSEIFQMTAPIRRFAAWLAGHGYLVLVPEIYHELEPAGTVLAYDQAGSDQGNHDKYAKELASYDDDARALAALLERHPRCTGAIGAVGICLGGHLAFRTAMLPAVRATVCFYATDIHSGTLGHGQQDDSLARAAEIRGELLHVWGRQDPHVPLEGRRKVQARLDQVQANYQWLEVNGAHAFLRDEGYRYDPELAHLLQSWMLALFHRTLAQPASAGSS